MYPEGTECIGEENHFAHIFWQPHFVADFPYNFRYNIYSKTWNTLTTLSYIFININMSKIFVH